MLRKERGDAYFANGSSADRHGDFGWYAGVGIRAAQHDDSPTERADAEDDRHAEPDTAKVEPALIVMNAAGATLADNKLTLTGIAPNAIIFADRPTRAAGHALTVHLLEEWGDAADASFAKDPPNATVSAFSKDGSLTRDAVVVLKNPNLQGDQLTFEVQVLEGDLKGADGPASVFIDIIGLPFTPLSFAGVARRTAYRAAMYNAAVAHPYYGYPAPYYPPAYYPPPPRCGVYPLPPCY